MPLDGILGALGQAIEGLTSLRDDARRKVQQAQAKADDDARERARLAEYERDLHTAVHGNEMEKLIIGRKYGKRS